MKPLKIRAREAILEAAAAVLARNPGTSLSEIALHAGVGRATLHRHFPSRDDLIRALAREAIEQTNAATVGVTKRATAREELRAMLEAVIPLGSRFHFLRRETPAYSDDEVSSGYRQQLRYLDRLVERLKSEGEIAPEVPKAWVVAVIDSLIWVAWSTVEAGRVAPEDAARLAFRTVVDGLRLSP